MPRLGISIVGQGVDSYEAWKQLSIDNVRRMIRRDWNHPAIILWSVRINESKDDHDFYTRTNALAHQLDPTRQTGGIRVDLHAQAEALKSGKHEVIIEIASELVAIVRLTRARLAPATTMI